MTQIKNVNIVPDGSINRVHVSQGDIGRTLQFNLYDGALAYTPTAGSTVKIQGTKPSGLGFSESCIWSGNVVTVDTTDEMTDEYGYIDTELVITSSDESEILGTANFILAVERNPHPDGTVDGTVDNPVIKNLEIIITNAVDEWLDEHPEATTTVQDGSITESKLANALKEKIENVFIDGIEVEEAFDSTSNTTYYLTTIPYSDDGTQNEWKVGIANDNNANLNTLESTLSFAIRKNASVCVNGGPFHLSDGTNVPYGVLIQDGVVLQDIVSTLSSTNILGIKSDGSFVTFDATTTTAQTVLNAGCVNAIVGYKTLIQDGSAIADSSATVNPRQVICRKTNGDYLIFTCDGKTESDVGMTRSDVQRILLTKSVDFAFELDGGGSTSTVVKYQKINKNIDSQYIDREVENFLYMTKGIRKEDINDIYEIVSELRQNIVDALVNLEVYSGVIKLFSQSNEPNLEYYTSGNRTDRVGRIRLNSDGLNIKWTPAGGTETDLLTATSSYMRYLGVPFGNFMNYCTNTASSTNVNNLNNTGFYYATSDSTNTPKAGNFLVLHINLTETGSNKQQFAFPIAETNGYIYSRRMTTANPTWTSWQPCGLFTSTTSNRPTTGLKNGTMYFDTTLNIPIWYNNGNWYDANGTQV